MIVPSAVALDYLGVGFFSVTGAMAAAERRQDVVTFLFFGAITGVGGGTLRDMLLARVPAVLRVDVYATAAMLGAAVMVVAVKLRAPPSVAAAAGIIACFALRMTAATFQWNLPRLGM